MLGELNKRETRAFTPPMSMCNHEDVPGDVLGASDHSSVVSDDFTDNRHNEDHNNKTHPLHAIGNFLGNGIQSHVRKWKRDHTRKKLESHLSIVQQARLEIETYSETSSGSLHSLGDIGVTLFSPLEGAFDSSCVDSRNGSKVTLVDISPNCSSRDVESDSTPVKVEPDDSVTANESEEDDYYHNDVFIFHDGTELEAPRLLTMDMMRQLRQAMPSSTQLKIWKRLYSLARDGDVFQTFLSSVAGHRQTLLVIQTSTGEMFGGFAEAHWGKLAMRTDGAYHGTGRSFLFSIDSVEHALQVKASSPSTIMLSDEASIDHVTIHPWQGVNEYSILCSIRDGGRLAMGGGAVHGAKDASFGFCVQDHFSKGSSGACATFGNKTSLSSSEHYDIVDFEVYGFVHSWC